jgi:YD repeat-containing protein
MESVVSRIVAKRILRSFFGFVCLRLTKRLPVLAVACAVYAPACFAQTAAWRAADYWCNLYECSTRFDPASGPTLQQGIVAGSYADAAALQFSYLTAYWNANSNGRGPLTPGVTSYFDFQSAGVLWNNTSTWQNCNQTGVCWTVQEPQGGQVAPFCRTSANTLKPAIWTAPFQWQCHSCPEGSAWSEDANACVPFPIDEGSCGVGNPVLPGTGRKLHEETDYAGAGTAALNLRRFYRSQWTDSAIGVGLTPTLTDSAGWRLSIHARLTLLPSGHVRAFRPDGTTIDFSPSAATAQSWVASSSRDGLKGILGSNGQRSGYTYTASADDATETYDAAGKLLSIKARNGWVTALTYNSAGQLTSVRNQFGRELRFTYDTKGRLAELLPPGAITGTASGTATSPIRYAYAEAASLGAGVAPKDQLTSVIWQDGQVRRYHYEDSRFAQALTGITDEAGVRYATYTYDAQGRVSQTGHVGGVDRVDFSYGTSAPQTIVTDYSGPNGSATTRTYTFQNTGGVMRPTAVTAPCPLCGNTQASTVYDAGGNVTKTIAHDGSVTFYAYDSKGRETERATFASSYQSATTRPALSAATKVVSTQWHATWNLPTQVAEPSKITANTYDSKGNLTGQSWTATTDATGAAKFTAVKTGSAYATGWGWNTSGLNTSIVVKIDAVETGRWTLAYASNGDMAQTTDVKGGNRIGRATQYDAHGRLLAGSEVSGRAVAMTYTARGSLQTEAYDGAAPTVHEYNRIGFRTKTTTVHGDVTEYRYDSAQRLVDVLSNGVSLSDPAIGASLPERILRTVATRLAAIFVSDAHAQAVIGVPIRPGQRPMPPLPPGVINPGSSGFQDWLNGQDGRSRDRDSSCDRSRDRNCDRCDPKNPEHRGRIQAQDDAPTAYEDSVAWAQCDPYKYVEAVMAVDTLMARMPADRARTKYRTSPAKMKRYFYEKSQQGGATAGDRASYRDVGQANARIDAEVHLGRAYVP